MVLMAGMDLPTRAIREQIVSALHVMVHMHRFRDGSRRVTQVSDVVGLQGDEIVLADIFAIDYAAGFGTDGRFDGELWPTGAQPTFASHLADLGIALPEVLLQEADPLAPQRRW
jgi:pilus assembly protein CpaF